MTADDLIELAYELARRDPGRPKSVSLRRAASSAYYAMFHALAYLCADQLIGWRKPYPVFSPIYRTLDHGKARSVLDAMRKQSPRNTAVETMALAFAELQDARYDADYNPEPFRFNRTGTIELVELAEKANAAISILTGEQKLALAVKLVIKAR